MKKIAIVLLLGAMTQLCAQEQPNPNETITRAFTLKYVAPSQMARLLGYDNRQADDSLKVLIVHSQRRNMAEIEKSINGLDVPQPPVPNVEVTVYLMSALAQPATVPIPAELEGVVAQLRNMFSYKGYQLIDTQIIRIRAGQGGYATGIVDRNPIGQARTLSDVRFGSAKVSTDEKGRAIHIDGLRVGLRVPIPPTAGEKATTGVNYASTGISTDVDVHEGQKVVVGKANMDGTDRASIVVLTAKVVD